MKHEHKRYRNLAQLTWIQTHIHSFTGPTEGITSGPSQQWQKENTNILQHN